MKRIIVGLLAAGVCVALSSAADIYWHVSINKVKTIDPRTHIRFLKGQSGFRGEQSGWGQNR